MEPIRRTFTVDDLRPAAAAAGVTTTVLVQTVPSEDETRELLAIAEADSLVGAVTGWVDLTAPDVADRIAALREEPGGHLLRAIRHGVQDEPDPDWLYRPEVRRGLRALAEACLCFELLVRPEQLPQAIDTVRAVPDLQFVLDHCAKPLIDPYNDAAFTFWKDQLWDLKQTHTTVCKVSGLVTEFPPSSWSSWDRDHLYPFLEIVYETFGVERMMFGSDWPVCLLATTYQEWIETVEGVYGGLSFDDRQSIFADTAARVYGLHLERPRRWPCE
jgi:L-fuconolactonase